MKNIILVVILSVLCSACSITTHYIQSNAQKYSPTNPDNIKVYSNDIILDNYIVIGSLATLTQGDGESAIMELKKEASEIGADAIIALRLDKLNSISQGTEASGIAVKIN